MFMVEWDDTGRRSDLTVARVTRASTLTGRVHTRRIYGVTPSNLQSWQDGDLISDAMPNVSADDREFLLTGITPEEWELYIEGKHCTTYPVGE